MDGYLSLGIFLHYDDEQYREAGLSQHRWTADGHLLPVTH